MSSVIAVSVSLIGLLGVVFTLAIFLQMILSFPTMLSNNSQTYVQQQRKLYNIGTSQREAMSTPGWDAPLLEEEEEEEEEEEGDEDKSLEDRWVDMPDDEDAYGPISDVASVSSIPRRAEKRTAADMRRRVVEPMTRGRSLRRSRRRYSARTVMRVQDIRPTHYDVDPCDTTDCISMRTAGTTPPARAASGKQDCVVGWRTMEWTR